MSDHGKDVTEALLVSESEARSLLGVGYTTLKRLRREGAIRSMTIGRRVLIERASIVEFVKRGLSLKSGE